MMDHAYFRDKISAYSDGALEAQEKELIRRHLEECAECRALLQKLIRLTDAIEKQSGLKADEYFERLASEIEKNISPSAEKVVEVRVLRWKSLWWKVSAVAASVLLVATIGYYQYQGDRNLPAKIMEDLRANRETVPVKTDSVSEYEKAELPGGRSDATDLAGKVAESESPQAKTEESIVSVKQEKDRQTAPDEDLLRRNADYAPSANVVLKPSELKGKTSVPEAPSSEKAGVSSIVADEAAPEGEFDAISDSISVPELNLMQWRIQRDSIQNVLGLEQDTVQNSRHTRMNKLAAPSVSGLVKIEDSTKIYQELANAWFQIALQTKDENEKNRAVQFLNWYKIGFPTDSPAVNVQLRQVPK